MDLHDTDMFGQASQFAIERHRHQRRKGRDVPYFAHLLGTAALVLQGGGPASAAIVALLHDVLEDTATQPTEIANLFGEATAAAVLQLSEYVEVSDDTKPSRAERRRAYLEKLALADIDQICVSLCDKIDTLADYLEELRDGVLAGKNHEFVCWFYRHCQALYHDALDSNPHAWPYASVLLKRLDDGVASLAESVVAAAGAGTLLVLSGLPGSGKSTTALELAARHQAVHLSSDRMRRANYTKPTYTSDESGRIYRLMRQQARLHLSGGDDVIVDATNLHIDDWERWQTIADFARCRIIRCLLTCDDEVAAERLRTRTNSDSDADFAVRQRMADRSDSTVRWDLVIDTSLSNPTEVADQLGPRLAKV
jgi:predicted kinase